MSKLAKTQEITEEEIRRLLEADRAHSPQVNNQQRRQASVKNIVQKAKTETSAKAVAEYTTVSIWTAMLEFVAVFCIFMNQKSVNKKSIDKD